MGFTKRRACSKSKISPENFSEIKEQFLIDVEAVVDFEEVPPSLVINWDHEAMKIVPSSQWTMEKSSWSIKVQQRNVYWSVLIFHLAGISPSLPNTGLMKAQQFQNVIVPYLKKERKALKLNDGHCALTLFDVFKGHCTA